MVPLGIACSLFYYGEKVYGNGIKRLGIQEQLIIKMLVKLVSKSSSSTILNGKSTFKGTKESLVTYKEQ